MLTLVLIFSFFYFINYNTYAQDNIKINISINQLNLKSYKKNLSGKEFTKNTISLKEVSKQKAALYETNPKVIDTQINWYAFVYGMQQTFNKF